MYFDEILEKAYVKAEEPIDGEIVLLPSGFKPSIESNMVISTADFEAILMAHRASEPASEAVLTTIGKACRAGVRTDATAQVWEKLCARSTVLDRYTALCNAQIVGALDHLGGGDEAQISPAGEEDVPSFDSLSAYRTQRPAEQSASIIEDKDAVVLQAEEGDLPSGAPDFPFGSGDLSGQPGGVSDFGMQSPDSVSPAQVKYQVPGSDGMNIYQDTKTVFPRYDAEVPEGEEAPAPEPERPGVDAFGQAEGAPLPGDGFPFGNTGGASGSDSLLCHEGEGPVPDHSILGGEREASIPGDFPFAEGSGLPGAADDFVGFNQGDANPGASASALEPEPEPVPEQSDGVGTGDSGVPDAVQIGGLGDKINPWDIDDPLGGFPGGAAGGGVSVPEPDVPQGVQTFGIGNLAQMAGNAPGGGSEGSLFGSELAPQPHGSEGAGLPSGSGDALEEGAGLPPDAGFEAPPSLGEPTEQQQESAEDGMIKHASALGSIPNVELREEPAEDHSEELQEIKDLFGLFFTRCKQYGVDKVVTVQHPGCNEFALSLVGTFPVLGSQLGVSMAAHQGQMDAVALDLVNMLQIEAESAVQAGDLERAMQCGQPIYSILYE